MSARPNLRQSLGREAIYSQPAGGADHRDDTQPEEARRSWADLHSRATYHLPVDLQQAIAEEAARSGRSKSRVVADALRAYLGSTVNGRR